MAIFAILLLSFIFHDAIKKTSTTLLQSHTPHVKVAIFWYWRNKGLVLPQHRAQSSTFIHNYNVLAVSDLIPSSQALSRPWLAPVLVTNSILFCLLFKIKDQCRKVRFQKPQNQGLRLLCGTAQGCSSLSVVTEATHEVSQGPLIGTVSAQKSPSRVQTETRELLGGMEEKSVSRRGALIFFTFWPP